MTAFLLFIEWKDSAQPIPEWQHLDDFELSGPCTCFSVGRLIHDGADAKALVPNKASGMIFSHRAPRRTTAPIGSWCALPVCGRPWTSIHAWFRPGIHLMTRKMELLPKVRRWC